MALRLPGLRACRPGQAKPPPGKIYGAGLINICPTEPLSIISSVTNRGKMRFKVFEGAMNAGILIDFMKRLVQEVKKGNAGKVFLVLDNLKVHHARRNSPP